MCIDSSTLYTFDSYDIKFKICFLLVWKSQTLSLIT